MLDLQPCAQPDDSDLVRHLDEVLAARALNPVYQPIVAVREQRIFGYEALIRGPQNSALHHPGLLFETAQACGRLAELDQLCREICLRTAGRLGLPGTLFFNASPEHVLDMNFPHAHTGACARESGLVPDRAVMELTEQYPVHDFDRLRAAVCHYRDMGFAIALDDLGAGYAGLRLWFELRPDFVKIDRHFVQDVHLDAAKRQFIHSICEIAHILGCKVIAEGIESQDEYQVIRSLGVHYAQGFLFARPQADPPRVLSRKFTTRHQPNSGCINGSELVGSLLRDTPCVDPSTSVDQVIEFLQTQPQLRCLPVVDSDNAVGLVKRAELLNMYAGRYGRELHGRKQIREFMQHAPLVVRADSPVEELSLQITERGEAVADDDFIIVDAKESYMGTGTLIDLLKKITDLQVRNARYANPLTQLPGNVPINEHIDRLLGNNERFVAVHVDVDNFKPFNDTYGYARGDDLIRNVARLLVQLTNSSRDFVGHLGGDDYILVLRSREWQTHCEQILFQFEQLVPRLYDSRHREAGGIVAHDRAGNEHSYPFVTLSMGAVLVDPNRHFSHHEVAALASEVKAHAKRSPGNVLLVDRRSNET